MTSIRPSISITPSSTSSRFARVSWVLETKNKLFLNRSPGHQMDWANSAKVDNWHVRIGLGLNKRRWWFLNFYKGWDVFYWNKPISSGNCEPISSGKCEHKLADNVSGLISSVHSPQSPLIKGRAWMNNDEWRAACQFMFAFTGRNRFTVFQWKSSEDPPFKNRKTPVKLIYACIYQYISKIVHSIWWPSPIKLFRF